MLPNEAFVNREDRFWAVVKLVSETFKYSDRSNGKGGMRRYTVQDIKKAHESLHIPSDYCSKGSESSQEALDIVSYLNYRSDVLESYVRLQLMDRGQSKAEFEKLQRQYPNSQIKIQMNKQKGEKRHPNYLTGMVNLVAENVFGFDNFDCNPMKLGIVSDQSGPLKVLCRRMDGAFPSTFNTKLMWEIKEYYGTTTFGSRIADGVYETMLVGEELNNLMEKHQVKIYHVLFIDDYLTWWGMGRSYLCRLIDMLHIGQVDAIFFGKEVCNGEWEEFAKMVNGLPS